MSGKKDDKAGDVPGIKVKVDQFKLEGQAMSANVHVLKVSLDGTVEEAPGGESRASSSVGYTKSYAEGWEAIWGKKDGSVN